MKTIKIKLSRMEVSALFDFFFTMLTFVDMTGFVNMLIKENMYEVLEKLEKMNNNPDQKKFTLKLTGAQSMAFVAYTGGIQLERSPYEQVIINRIIETIDKTHINARIF